MKQGLKMDSVMDELMRQAKSKRDFRAPRRLLKMGVEGDERNPRIVLQDTGTFGVTQTGHDQLAQRLQIPKEYYHRMLQKSPLLLRESVNTWLDDTGDQVNLVRTLDGNVRGVLGPSYRPLDSFDLMRVLAPLLSELDMRVQSSNLSDKTFYLKVVTPRLKAEVRGDTINFGLVFSNSEIGYRSFTIEDLIFVLSCSNGSIHSRLLRRRHVGKSAREQLFIREEDSQDFMSEDTKRADDRAFFLKVRDMVAGRLSEGSFEKIVASLQDASKREISDQEAVVTELKSGFEMSDEEIRGITQALFQKKDFTQYGLMNAMTSFSQQETVSYERATELEQIAGEIAAMKDTEWNSLQTRA